MALKVFISWSGKRSHKVALALREWLPRVIQQARPWVSSEDINKGAAWLADIEKELLTTTRGIVCLTPGNQSAPWLNYEAGALAKQTGQTRVCVGLLGVETADLSGPLKNFQVTHLLDKADLRKLVKTLNSDLPEETRLAADLLSHSFDREWDALAEKLVKILNEAEEGAIAQTPRTDREILEEVLDVVRAQSRVAAKPFVTYGPSVGSTSKWLTHKTVAGISPVNWRAMIEEQFAQPGVNVFHSTSGRGKVVSFMRVDGGPGRVQVEFADGSLAEFSSDDSALAVYVAGDEDES